MEKIYSFIEREKILLRNNLRSSWEYPGRQSLNGSLIGIILAGLQKSKYNIEEYNKENALERGYGDYAARKTEEILSQGRNADRGNQLIGVVNACIMIFTTIIFLICGFGFDLWEKCWIAYPVGVLLCGIASIILNFICNRK